MGRRAALAVGVTASGAMLDAPNIARAQAVSLRMATGFSGGPLMEIGSKAFAGRVAFLSDTRLRIRVFPGGALGNALRVSETVRHGVGVERLIRILESPTRGAGIVAAWPIVPLILGTTREIVLRYVFTAPTIWGFEFATMLTGANWVLGAALVLAAGGHVRTDIVAQRFPPRLAAVIDLAGYVLLTLPILAWLAIRLREHFLVGLGSGERTGASVWNPPVWPMRLVLFIGFVLLTLQVVVEVLKRIRLLSRSA